EENQILTNETEMNIEYIASIEDYNAWSALAIDTFADRLAAELAYPVTGVVAASKQRWEIYNNKLKIMRGRDRRLGSPKEYIADEWLNARIGIVT
ncbi:MAG: hypothetical protein GY938_13300, partial [Ketobacter sp.]|nr:hypothetical protein [Ketobacter sp.]